MECVDIKDVFSAYLDGDLPDEDRERISQHLLQCPLCAGEERALRETISLLGALPPLAAPPELLEGVHRGIGREAPPPLWKKVFSPARVKIPLEVAAVALIVLVAYGVRKEMPVTRPAPVVSSAPVASGPREVKSAKATKAPPRAPAEARPGRQPAAEREEQTRIAESATGEAASPEAAREASPPPAREKPSVAARSEIAPGLAARVSTGGGTIGAGRPRESPAPDIRAFRVFAEPASRMLAPSAFEREVTIAVDRDKLPGIEERIEEIADRLGGTVRRDEAHPAPAGRAEGPPPAVDVVRVHLPSVFADIFLEELETLGTVPQESAAGRPDIPSGPSPDTVLYTVRIRLR